MLDKDGVVFGQPSRSVFNWTLAAVNKELSAANEECSALWWNQDEVLSNLKKLETDLGESVEVASQRSTKRLFIMSKQFETEFAQGLGNMFAYSA